ncbi:unnamed protein product [Moneuplotes crassus]|uniref:Uncharacterized protein n=1 Tax=Euplotes crassus TaxID=5936 RepID=A0AAD1XEM3_EUPCR|nr:unnamed protein product [Moneuplotes crassus]
MVNIKISRIAESVQVGPYQWGKNKISLNHSLIKSILSFYKKHDSLLCEKIIRTEVDFIDREKIAVYLKCPEDQNDPHMQDSEIEMQFGIQSMSAKSIIELSNRRRSTQTKEELMSIYNKTLEKNQSEGYNQQDNLLDFSDAEILDQLEASPRKIKHILDIIDLVYLTSAHPNVAFDITQISKLKICNYPLSNILVNNPKHPEAKLKSMNSGYLTLDEVSRLVPVPTNLDQILDKPCVGVWIYGLDIPNYQCSSDESDMVRESELSIKNNKEEYKLSLIKSPFLWSALVKFLIDKKIKGRFSISDKKDKFLLVHFLNQSSSPQFYEFSLSSVFQNIRDSIGTERHGIKTKRTLEGYCTVLGLNNKNPFSSETVKVDKITRISQNKNQKILNAYCSKSVKNCIKDIFKRKNNRSSSRKSITSSRMSMEHKGSLGRLRNTIDHSNQGISAGIRQSNDRNAHHPENIRLKLISENMENIHTNISSQRGRNSSLGSYVPMTTNGVMTMTKSNTLTKLFPNASNEFKKRSLLQAHKMPHVRGSYNPPKDQRDNSSRAGNLKQGESRLETLNISCSSGKNVDSSDMVLKGDVTPSMSKNFSHVEASHQTLRFDGLLKKQTSDNSANNMRYGMNETQSDFLEIMSPKHSPDVNRYSNKVNNYPDMHSKMQADKIQELQREVAALKEKLSYYEKNYKYQKPTSDACIGTEELELSPKMNSDKIQFSPKFEENKSLKNTGEFCFGKLKNPDKPSLNESTENEEDSYDIPVKYPSSQKSKCQIQSNEQEQQSSKFYNETDLDEKSPNVDFNLSNSNIGSTPLKNALGKSPLLDKDETDSLFKSKLKGSPLDSEENDTSMYNYRMINPMDKSGFTPDSIGKSAKRYSEKSGQEWTIEIPKMENFDDC